MNYLQRQDDIQGMQSTEQAIRGHIDGAIKNLHTTLPGIIVSFDPAKQTAQVQPAIKRIFIEQGAVNLPVCVDVPVVFPGGGGYFLTFPVSPGDECVLMFSERCIDYWYEYGETQPPAEYRLHDLSDGIAIVGLNSQPRAIAGFNMGCAELRHRSGGARIRLFSDSVEIIAPGGVSITGNVTVDGEVTANGIPLSTHIHGGVASGDKTTGVPQ